MTEYGLTDALAIFERAYRENSCGDVTCLHRRLTAAIAVLTGASTHTALAEVIERAQGKQSILPPGGPIQPETLAAMREDFANLPMTDRLREAGLQLCEVVAHLQVNAPPRSSSSGPRSWRGSCRSHR